MKGHGMTKLPAFQFYPGDWRKDVGVQSLDYFDRRVWWEMLCLMHESEWRGALVLNGQAMSEGALALLLGLDKQKHGGWTPMHAVAQNGDLPFAKILLEAGADVSARAENNQRPLDLALTKGQQHMVEFLETHGAAL